MANFKRKRRKWSTACGLCKYYKRFGGNGKIRVKPQEYLNAAQRGQFELQC